MAVVPKLDNGVMPEIACCSIDGLLGKRHIVACIDLRAIFYGHASPWTEFMDIDDHAYDDANLTLWESNDG